MGCDGFWKFITSQFPNCHKELSWTDLKDKVIAIEGNGCAFKYNYNGNDTSLFLQFCWLVIDLFKVGVKDVIIVFDGNDTIDLKSLTREKRQVIQSQIKQKKTELVSELSQIESNSTTTTTSEDDSKLNWEIVNKFAPRFFSNLKRKLNQSDQISDQDLNPSLAQTIASDTQNVCVEENAPDPNPNEEEPIIIQDSKIHKITKKELQEQRKKEEKEWIEEQMKTWSKKDFLDTVLKRNEKINPVKREHYEFVVQMLRLLGVKAFFCQGEAEAYCATLSALGIVDYVVSDDSDLFPFGAKYILRGVSTRTYRSQPLKLYDTELLREKANISKWSDVCSLITNDYNRDGCKLDRLGVNTAVKLVSDCKDKENPRLAALKAHYQKLEECVQKKSKPKTKRKSKKDKKEDLDTQEEIKSDQKQECDSNLLPVLKGQYSIEEIESRTEKINEYFTSYHIPEDESNKNEMCLEIRNWINEQKEIPNYEKFIEFCKEHNLVLDSFQKEIKKEWHLFQPDWEDPKVVFALFNMNEMM